MLGQPTEHLPPELITALNRHQDEFGLTIGTWNYTVGDANYRVAFSHYDSNEITDGESRNGLRTGDCDQRGSR